MVWNVIPIAKMRVILSMQKLARGSGGMDHKPRHVFLGNADT